MYVFVLGACFVDGWGVGVREGGTHTHTHTLTHTHTHTHTLSHTHTHTHTHIISPHLKHPTRRSVIQTRTLTHAYSLTHSLTRTYPLQARGGIGQIEVS